MSSSALNPRTWHYYHHPNIHVRRLSLQEVGRLPQVSREDRGLSPSGHSPARLPDPRPLPLLPRILFFFNEQGL